VLPASLFPRDHVSVDDLQAAADLFVDVEERLPGEGLVLKTVLGGGHRIVSSSVKLP
jgi:hypothetical protein